MNEDHPGEHPGDTTVGSVDMSMHDPTQSTQEDEGEKDLGEPSN